MLTFLCWPLGLLLSYLALRRIRKSGDGGWGLAVAGTALSTVAGLVFIVAGLHFLATSGIAHDWEVASARRSDERAVRSVTKDVVHELADHRKSEGKWPSTIRELDLDFDEVQTQDVADDDADATVRGVTVVAHRDGAKTCVDGVGPTTLDQYSGSYADGEFRKNVSCTDRGVSWTLKAAANVDRRAREHEALEVLAAPIRKRAQVTAAVSSIGDSPDMGLLGHNEIDLSACAAIAGNYTHVEDQQSRAALIDVIRKFPVTAGTRETAAGLQYGLDTDNGGLDHYFDETLLREQFDCWLGGYVGPGPKPTFPASWTIPLTAKMVQADNDRVAAYKAMTPEQKHANLPAERAASDREQAEIAAAVEANR